METTATTEMRSIAREVFQVVLDECNVQKAFEQHIACDRGVLRIAQDLYDLRSFERIFVVSIGKAAHTMVEALVQRVGPVEGIVSAPIAVEPYVDGFTYFRGGHPLPNADSIRAANAIIRGLAGQNDGSLIIFMISGGASALCEKPTSDSITLDDLVATYRALVHSGAPIAQINAIRKHLSAIKGGRMAIWANGSQQVSLFISDVPDNAPDSLASGPTMPDSTTVNDCYAIANRYGLVKAFPPSVRVLFENKLLQETPKAHDAAFANSRWWTLLSNDTAVKAAARSAAGRGFAVEVDNSCDDWDYQRAADHLLKRLRQLRRGVSRACLISGGEVTVKVSNGGTGGRNQQFALYCATQIKGDDITVLSGGTDGIDGNSTFAGAVADGSTLQRARDLGVDADTALAEFNASPLFEALGDAIITGPTGTNVRDVRILFAY